MVVESEKFPCFKNLAGIRECNIDFYKFRGENPGIYHDFEKFSGKNPGMYLEFQKFPDKNRESAMVFRRF